MASIDVSVQRAQLLQNETLLNQLPADLLQIIRSHATAKFLDAVAAAALIPQCTGHIFTHFESIFADICARWILRPRNEGQDDQVIAAFARILPFAPHLSVFLELYIRETSLIQGYDETATGKINSLDTQHPPTSELDLLRVLLSFLRLLNFDQKTFGPLVRPSRVQTLFKHASAPVRYLAIKVFCRQLNASDHKLEALLSEHVNSGDPLVADFDGVDVDYSFLSILEHRRAEELEEGLREMRSTAETSTVNPFPLQPLTNKVVRYGNTLLPRPNGQPTSPSSMIQTTTTSANLENLAKNLQRQGPILLHGMPGSGKTSSVHELARELGMESSLVTLYLNEQTDAKMLIGLYSTDSKPGSFSWRPGVLTTAVREGRWVLIEDLDRAPNEVISTLLPLVEYGKLLIPSRGETIEAPSTFRLFATVRTTRGMHGQESLPSLLGQRFWHLSSVTTPQSSELGEIILGKFPILHKYTPMIMAVYRRLYALPNLSSSRSTAERQITPRDLLKWCHRLTELLISAGCRTGDEPISETTRDWMFMEAVDCFCGSFSKPDTKALLVNYIAEEMHLPQQLMDHYLNAHVPQIEESPSNFKVGRVMLTRRRHANRISKSKKPFASTSHARRLLEQIASAVRLREPVLLVGETGIGKTTVVQQLAETLGHKLVAVNLSQQSEVGDLLGGFKPVNARSLAVPLKEEFEDLFTSTGISASKNQKYLEQIGKCTAKGQWTRVSKLWREAPKMFNKIVKELHSRAESRNGHDEDDRPAVKRRKTQSRLQTLLELRPRWEAFAENLEQFDVQISGGSGSFAFAFVEGNIVKAARNGDWVLLDEINLASPDTLESIADLLTSGPNDEPSILLSETGEIERVRAHPDFRIFGAMNPATDIGKRDLPLGLRSRFTELYVGSPDKDLKDLLTIIKTYLSGKSVKDDQAADDIARLYLNTKKRAEEKRLVDGANEVPHFSLRTLTRVLSYVNDISPSYGLRRALFEGFSMGFLTLLDRASEETLVPLIHHHLLEKHGNARSLLSQPPRHPNDGKNYVKFMNKNRDRQYWLLQGSESPMERADYIVTPYIERNLLNLVRATSTRRFPILIQGPTSAGKTSMIEYLANFSGNKFVRINNHEHTDLQEYLGTYVSDSEGRLRFQEGLLVQALRQGHWIVLDELNLAPTDVLEALNRLLDDNRELLIPETQEVVRPHENFMLFATQNPPGLYGGRKVLSRAFRNRFLELHFDDIPEDELETILQKRSLHTAPSDCRRIVTVYKELSRLRQTSRLFENKDSFATLRDLFRWALRGAESREEIAANGFMLLAERVRNDDERTAVKKVIETVFKVKVDQEQLYNLRTSPYLRVQLPENSHGVVWTQAMRRLYVLVASAIRHNEPVLLVGETGCGKTTVCQLLAESLGKELHIVNAHQNTETGDLIGSQRPIRNRGAILESLMQDLKVALCTARTDVEGDIDSLLQTYHSLDPGALLKIPAEIQRRISDNEVKSRALFEWADGSLVQSMRDGQFFLLDEISLADDSVLERLNSVLEPQRSLLLAEKGITDSFVKATEGFQFLATMNPGGDFGKKELSPALRNRFTEIWVPPLSENQDVLQIVSSKLRPEYQRFSQNIVDFAYWFGSQFRSTASTAFSIRDILVWVKFINESNDQDGVFSVVHGASTVFIDTLGANPSALIAIDLKSMDRQRQACLDKLTELLGRDATAIYRAPLQLVIEHDNLRIGDFSIGRAANDNFEGGFALHAPTTKLNAMRIIRALRVQKPILLEGSPGVGKTTLVSALARACGRPLTRINLSDQTDLMDLFGTDVPVEGAETGHFAWRDAPFLRAMQNGEWVLLDEMNLASQSVLEGLNACLDHRGEVYVSELDQVFKRHPDFRLFAAQNPHHQGGGRKGLPSSFVNRFIVVYADVFSEEDLLLIAQHNFPAVATDTVRRLIDFISNLESRILVERAFGSQGSPWEFNLRDTLRWLHLLTSSDALLGTGDVNDFLGIAIRQRFRTQKDRDEVDKLFTEAFGAPPKNHQLYHNISSSSFQVGLALMQRNQLQQPSRFPNMLDIPRLPEIESLLICVKQNLPAILVGPSGSGKSTLLQYIAALAGKSLVTFPMNADIDTMDLVGGFEQSDPLREVNIALKRLQETLEISTMTALPQDVPDAAVDLLNMLKTLGDYQTMRHRLLDLIKVLHGQIQARSDLAITLTQTAELLQRPTGIKDPRFEWLDGIIVQALQKGQWLVLDNANLCSASVLDRLNSLLEPDGYLIINEHCGPNGEPRIVKPHPDFRVFLTVDPRYGELSRAMRNRAVEIYVEPHTSTAASWRNRIAELESSLQRLHLLDATMSHDVSHETSISQLAGDSLSFTDVPLLMKFPRRRSSLIKPLPLIRVSLKQSIPSDTAVNVIVSFVTNPTFVEIERVARELRGRLPESDDPGIADVQPLHPLCNSPAVPILQRYDPELPFWLASCYELCQTIIVAWRAIEEQKNRATGMQVSALNRLQRSFVADSVAAVSKDSTIGAAKFLFGVLQRVEAYVRDQVSNSSLWRERRYLLRDLMHCWGIIFKALADSGSFEEAVFQAHLRNISAVLMKHGPQISEPSARQLLTQVLLGLDECFVAGFKLTTGLAMETLWKALRPVPIQNTQLFDDVCRMEQLAARFDSVKWRTTASPKDLANIMKSFLSVYQMIRMGESNADGLLQTLEAELTRLDENQVFESIAASPFLAKEFETLRQISMLDSVNSQPDSSSATDLALLSNLSLVRQMRLNSATETSRPLQSIRNLFDDNGETHWDSSISTEILSRLDSINLANLSSLATIEQELPILAQQVALSSKVITEDRLGKIRDQLWHILLAIVSTYDPSLGAAFSAGYESEAASASFSHQGLSYDLNGFIPGAAALKVDGDSTGAVKDHMFPAFVALVTSKRDGAESRVYLAYAWIQFAVGLVKLFVPNRAFDPQLRPLLELRSYEELQANLQSHIEALREFERFTNCQSSSLRCEIVEEEIADLGEPPSSIQTVYRPQASELPQIQAEFNSLLKVVLDSDIGMVFLQHCSGSDAATQQLQVTLENAKRISHRLSQKFRAYEDIVLPVVNIIHCLEIGLLLGKEAGTLAETQAATSAPLLKLAPFLGGCPSVPVTHSMVSRGFEFLTYAEAVVSVEGIDGLQGFQQLVFEAIHSFYDQWSLKLEADRKAEEAKKSLYRYRGDLNEEEAAEQEAFDSLFPAFDDDDQKDAISHSKIGDAKALAIKLARKHENIFLNPRPASTSTLDLIRAVGKTVEDSENSATDREMLPAALLDLDDMLSHINSADASTSYNFYTDPNLLEARKLVNLVNDIRTRFRQLQQVDEIAHMQPLVEVVSACDMVLELSHSDPLAKIIPRVEKLHGFVYEWQFGGWASKIYAVLPLHNRLTDMLVSWRRLELSTWGKLFDMEVKKCDEDAASWWFIAYQAIIAEPMNLAHAGENLQQHAAKLLKELENYFSSTPVGQFTSRLKLLRQLQKQLILLVAEYPAISTIRDALDHFITYYSRYEQPVLESIRTARAPIDKQMKDVLLLASWKDTNIVALRESARKSHQKLFRIVRKFREVLDQPLRPIIEKGLPDQVHTDVKASEIQQRSTPRIDHNAMKICQKRVERWTEDYKRLANVERTVELMSKLSRIPDSSLDAGATLEGWLSDLNSKALDLHKETPTTLTDENKVSVQSLKSLKRNLFADTLKTVRQMGIPYNLSTDILAQQGSLSMVLAGSQQLPDVDYYFHKMLDLAPAVRSTSQTHSEDLTSAEVNRSIGFIEGILNLAIGQRHELPKALTHSESLRNSLRFVQSLAALSSGHQVTVMTDSANYQKSASWLLEIIRLGEQLVELHAKFGGLDNTAILTCLQTWREKLISLSTRWESLPVLPGGLTSADRLEVERDISSIFNEVRSDLHNMCQSRPDLSFILEQIRLWVVIGEGSSSSPSQALTDIHALSGCVKSLCDSILVAVEQYHKKMAQLPTSPDDNKWLIKYNTTVGTALGTLHIDQVNKAIADSLTVFRQIDLENPNLNKLATSMMAVVAPIVEQYQNICDQAIRKYAELHLSTCKMGYTLSRSYSQLASQGFCMPQEKSDETSGQTEKLEGGTGLGDGEGAEDISKDIQPDEDLSELAQEGNKESGEEMQDEKDAVDMADQDLQGDLESIDGEEEEEKGSKSGEEDESGDEMDEETGDVDDLDPSAIDEKMWDGENEDDAEKDQEGENSKGQKKKDEQMAANDKPDKQETQPEDDSNEGNDDADEEELGAEEDEDVQQQQQDEANKQDQNVQDQDTLALPDDMEIDGKDDDTMSSISDDELDKLSDVDEKEKAEETQMGDDESEKGEDGGETDAVPGDEDKEDEASEGPEEDNANIQEDEEMGQDPEPEQPEEEREKAEIPSADDANASNENAAPSDVKSGGGLEQNADQSEDQDTAQTSAAQQEGGEMGEDAADQERSTGQKGAISQSQEQPSETDMDDAKDSSASQPFKALGDALEKWHRQRREIKEAQDKRSGPKPDAEEESSIREYQHLQNDETAAEAQAMGAANEEQTQPIDDSMAIDDEDQPADSRVLPEQEDEPDDIQGDKMDTSEAHDNHDKPDKEKEERQAGVSTRQGAFNRDTTPPTDGAPITEEVEETIQETSTQLSSTHLTEANMDLRDFDESMQQWTSYQSKTHPLSLSLTSQLRLILTPSQSTKLSGSYRTGKRLNIKRIIPYIASSYKRDKIWMRRAVPTKRAYQILLCVDDSRSMGGESSSGSLALESLVMVSRALTLLEAGQVGVLGFGERVFEAHDLAEPFASHDAGARVLQRFSFRQDHTDVELLVRHTLERFRRARLQNSSSGGGRGSEDLWQLALILSDGLTPSASHDGIRRLLREALEERIMIVFIVLDDVSSSPSGGGGKKENNSNSNNNNNSAGGPKQMQKQSVLNLKKVRFLGNDEIKTEYYLDTFPFQYYLIVHDLEELPGALAGLLRTWFAEVNS
ncbi:hypothetical protein F4778DRAFT_735131 [Xylariomycetidae sp. FL2044]|nr:hypothetical protein F4778DRAFT_735131 [Xylariomycetidae sp. FL2044]